MSMSLKYERGSYLRLIDIWIKLYKVVPGLRLMDIWIPPWNHFVHFTKWWFEPA